MYYPLFFGFRALLLSEIIKVASADKSTKSSFKNVTIGTVPNRGGVPEGYTRQAVQADVSRAKQQLMERNATHAASLKR